MSIGGRAPAGLAPAGRRLWREITAVWELRPDETVVLVAACRTADVVAVLDERVGVDGPMCEGSAGQPRVHPAVVEARQQRLALARLLGQLGLPDADDGQGATFASRRASRAARVRWDRHRARRGEGLTGDGA